MARVKTFTDGGTLLPGDLNSIEDDYELAFSANTVILKRNGAFPAATSTSQLLGSAAVLATAGTMTATNGDVIFYLDPAWFAAGARTTKYLVEGMCVVGGTAPAVTLTVGLYPVTFNSAAAAAFNTVTLGTVTAGSTVAFASPAVNTRSQGASGTFTAPAAGWYALGVASSGSTAASSVQTLYGHLQVSQV